MGLRCLLGHDFTEPRTEREREERGDEVIVSIREIKECTRCGETRVVSENKEVTSMDQLLEESGAGATPPAAPETDEAGDAGEGEEGVITDAESGETVEEFDHPRADAEAEAAAADADGEDAEIIDDGPSDADADADPAPADADADVGAEATAEEPATAGGTADADEDATADADGRAHGEWPDEDANRGDEPAAPDHEQTGWPDPTAQSDAGGEGTAPVEGESADVEIMGGEDADAEDSAANRARTEVVPDAKNPDAPAEDGAAGEDVEFIDGDGPSEWPDQAGEDEGYNAEVGEPGDDGGVSVDGNLTPRVDEEAVADEDAEFVGGASSGRAGASRSGTDSAGDADGEPGSSDDRSRSRDHGGETDADTGTRADASGTEDVSGSGTGDSAGRTTGPGDRGIELRTTAAEPDTVYVCPECGNREPVGASSMRAGDICPECRRGYIAERPLE